MIRPSAEGLEHEVLSRAMHLEHGLPGCRRHGLGERVLYSDDRRRLRSRAMTTGGKGVTQLQDEIRLTSLASCAG